MTPPALLNEISFTDVPASRLNHEHRLTTMRFQSNSETSKVSNVPAGTVMHVSLISLLTIENVLKKVVLPPLASKVQPVAVPFHCHDSPGWRGNAKSCWAGVYTVFVVTLEPAQPMQYSLTRDQFPGTIHRVSLYAALTSVITRHRALPQAAAPRTLSVLFPSI